MGKVIPVVNNYDESLKHADFGKLQLFLQVSFESIAFCLYDSNVQKFLSLEAHEFELSNDDEAVTLIKEVVDDHLIKRQKFGSVYVLYESNHSALVPAPLFDESETDAITDFSYTVSPGIETFFEKIENLDTYNLYTVSKALRGTIDALFSDYNSVSHSKILIESLLINYKNANSQKRIFVNIRKSNLDIAVLDGRKLLYFNTFACLAKEDYVYFIIFVMDRLNLSTEETELKLSGYIDHNSKTFDTIYKYIKHTSFHNRPNSTAYSYVFNDVPEHYFFSLLNIPSCVL
jgi:hypothetical protein